ncbi:MAG: bifunctional nuclease family protein [Candidatus Zixiibacteriota bacterium]|nr:MAG: bifunctional nuclease family protein [candidate division Zixibacteria bacterium]
MNSPKMIEAKISGLALDITTNSPVVTITPSDSDKILPIWIGHYEAWAISMEISGVVSKRPLTHDLLLSVVKSMKGQIEKVEIVDLKDQTFYALISISLNGETLKIDARPSDSLALALKAKAPIFVNERLFNLKKEQMEQSGLPDQESLRDRLRKINPEDFGHYKL